MIQLNYSSPVSDISSIESSLESDKFSNIYVLKKRRQFGFHNL